MATALTRYGGHLVFRSKIHVVGARLVSSTAYNKTQVEQEHRRGSPYLSPPPPPPHLLRSSTTGDNSNGGPLFLDRQPTAGQRDNHKNHNRLQQTHSSKPELPQKLLRNVLDHPSAAILLRDSCKCSKCKDPGTSQRNFNLAHIPANIEPSQIRQDSQNNWIIQWQNDMPGWEDHESIFTPQQIKRLETNMQKEHVTSARLWDNEKIKEERLVVNYEDYMNSSAVLAKTLYYFGRHGLVFIKNVPEDELSVNRLAQRIGFMKNTFYGETWDIRSIPNAKNVAYTNQYLGFHGDLIYMKEPPAGQFLHCLQNYAKGGENRFVDQLQAFDTLLTEDPDLAHTLADTKLRYEYDNDGFYYSDIKPIVQWRSATHQFPRRHVTGHQNQELLDVYRMFWAPQFLGSIMHDFGTGKDQLEKSLAAMKKYTEILERDDMVFEEKMEPGTAVFFDNLRILHSRNGFDPSTGKRWLRGTYLDGQDMWSLELKLRDHMLQFQMDESANQRQSSDSYTSV